MSGSNPFATLATPNDVATFLGTSWSQLRFLLYRMPISRRYRRFEVKKRKGGTRVISSPISQLKELQQRLLFRMEPMYQVRPGVHGFVRDRSIVSNAKEHVGKRIILNIDLTDFFPTIHLGRVSGMFRSKPFECKPKVATVLAQICCWDGKLAQGAPTSPMVSNFICRKLDTELRHLAGGHASWYSRYADDITFSTRKAELPPGLCRLDSDGKLVVGEALSGIIQRHKFQIHPEKIRVQHRHERQIVTGLKVNRFPNVPRKLLSQIRAMLYAWEHHGYEAAEREYREKFASRKHRAPYRGKPSFRHVLKGKLAYVGMVRGTESPVFRRLGRALRELDADLVKNWDLDTFEERVTKAICVVECLTDVNENGKPTAYIEQGTAFRLKDIGLVTCAHVVPIQPEIYLAKEPNRRLPAMIIDKSKDSDVALLKCDGVNLIELIPNYDEPIRGDNVKVAGYPNHGPGATGTFFTTMVTGSRENCDGCKRLLIDKSIVVGTSGGPVFDMNGRVVGVAVCGVKSPDESAIQESGFIPLRYLKDLLPT